MTRLGVRAARLPVLVYQAVRAGRPSPCRFEPSCSHYALQAIEVHGALHGSWLALRRIARCRPGGGRGIDDVPPPRRRRYTAGSGISFPSDTGTA